MDDKALDNIAFPNDYVRCTSPNSKLTLDHLHQHLLRSKDDLKIKNISSQIRQATQQNDEGGEDTVIFQVCFDEQTGASFEIKLTVIEGEGEDDDPDNPNSGKSFGLEIPRELIHTNDPEKADKIASAFANTFVDLTASLGAGKHYVESPTMKYKWSDLLDQKMYEAFIERADEFQKMGSEVYIDGVKIIDKDNTYDFKTGERNLPRSISEDRELDKALNNGLQSLTFSPKLKLQKDDCELSRLLQRAKDMKLEPEQYLRHQGFNPELPDNIKTLSKLAEQDNVMALEVLKSVAENQENASPLAQRMLQQVKSTKKDS